MAYSNEQSVELTKIPKNNRGDHIVVSKITNSTSGNVSVDIRQYYTDDNDDLLPTKKGVRFNTENLLEVMKALTGALEADEKEELVAFLNEVISDEDDMIDTDDDIDD